KIITVLALCFISISCSSDDVDEDIIEPLFSDDEVIGSWAYDTYTINGDTYAYPHREGCFKDVFIFRNNEGQEHQYEEKIHAYSNCGVSSTNLEWKIEGENLNLYYGEQLVITYEILSITKYTFTVLFITDFDEDGTEDEVEIKAI